MAKHVALFSMHVSSTAYCIGMWIYGVVRARSMPDPQLFPACRCDTHTPVSGTCKDDGHGVIVTWVAIQPHGHTMPGHLAQLAEDCRESEPAARHMHVWYGMPDLRSSADGHKGKQCASTIEDDMDGFGLHSSVAELLGQIQALSYERDSLKFDGRVKHSRRIARLLTDMGYKSLQLLDPAIRLVRVSASYLDCRPASPSKPPHLTSPGLYL